MDIKRCSVCDVGPSIREVEEKLSCAYYLSGWGLFVYRYFMKRIMPKIIEGWDAHNRLVQEGALVHFPIGFSDQSSQSARQYRSLITGVAE